MVGTILLMARFFLLVDLQTLLQIKQPLGTEIHHTSEKSTCTHWAVPYLLYQYVWENPSEYTGLRESVCSQNHANIHGGDF